MAEELLQKTRRLSGLLQASAGRPVSPGDIAGVVGENLLCATYILDDGEGILAHYFPQGFTCAAMARVIAAGGVFPATGVRYLAWGEQSRPNLCPEGDGCVFRLPVACPGGDRRVTAVPIAAAGRRLATMVLVCFGRDLTAADLVMAELAATIAGRELVYTGIRRRRNEERERLAVKVATAALSDLELYVVRRVLPVVEATEGSLVIARVARQIGCTRSVVVNALHKLKSAGVIEARSLGVKGTRIKVQCTGLADEVESAWRQRVGKAGGRSGERSGFVLREEELRR